MLYLSIRSIVGGGDWEARLILHCLTYPLGLVGRGEKRVTERESSIYQCVICPLYLVGRRGGVGVKAEHFVGRKAQFCNGLPDYRVQ